MAQSEVRRDSAGSLGGITSAHQDRVDSRRALMFGNATVLWLLLVAFLVQEVFIIGGVLLPKYGLG